jgi:hypothetical protein
VINYWAVLVVVVAAFVLSSVYYSVFGKARAEMLGEAAEERPQLWKMAVELVRSLVLAVVLAVFVDQQGINSLGGGLVLAALAWLAFPAVLLSGSVIWDNVSWRVAVLHGGDWLVKIFIMTAVLSVWR